MTEAKLENIINNSKALTACGTTAKYIPELDKADRSMLGACIYRAGDEILKAGNAENYFTIQSISKVLIFTCCLLDNPMKQVLRTVSLEPSADGFNSIVNLETKNYNKPLNPMINSGAIAALTLVRGDTPMKKFQRILAFARAVSGNAHAGINEQVYASEKESGSRNRALAYYMKSTGVIDGDIEAILDAYFRTCSIEMNCVNLARTAFVYAMDGSAFGHSFFDKKTARTVKAVMALCGMYDESGQVAVNIGLPSKSGVGGGIMSVAPGKIGIGIYGPSLNSNGSSIAGLAVLQQIACEMDLSIY